MIQGVYKYKSGAAASCGATVMMVFNKGVSYKNSSKLDNKWRYKILGRDEMVPIIQFFFTFSTNIQIIMFHTKFNTLQITNADFKILGGKGSPIKKNI